MTWQQKPRGRSTPTNSEALKRNRLRRGWSQEEFATLAGFSPRLIQKAESGQPIHPDTLETLAATLSTPEHPVFPEDLSASPKEMARKIIEAFAMHERQCVSQCEQYLAEDMQVIVPGDADLIPFCGEWDGVDGFDEFWEAMFSVLERPKKRLILDNMRVIGDGNEVVVLSKEMIDFCGAGVDVMPEPVALVMTFERGKLKTFEDHFDTRKAEESARRIIQRNAEAKRIVDTVRR